MNIDPRTTALVVIDVQNDFCAPGGYFDRSGADLSLIDPAINRLVQLLDVARAAGTLVVFVRNHYDPIYMSRTQNVRRQRVGWDTELCHAGSWGADFYKVAPLPSEPIVTKHRYDGFHGTDLELILRTNSIEAVAFAGVATSTCVETTLRNAFVRDFEVVLVHDCCAARSVRLHENSIDVVRLLFGFVASADEIEQEWRRSIPTRRAQTA